MKDEWKILIIFQEACQSLVRPESVYFKEGKLDLNKEMVLFCAGGLRSALAAKSLKDMGFEKVLTLMVVLEQLTK